MHEDYLLALPKFNSRFARNAWNIKRERTVAFSNHPKIRRNIGNACIYGEIPTVNAIFSQDSKRTLSSA
jgi:hypothetical protein